MNTSDAGTASPISQSRGAAMRLAIIATLAALCMALAGNLLYDAGRECAEAPLRILQACLLEAAPAVRQKLAASGVLALLFLGLSLSAIPVARRTFLRSRARIVTADRAPRFKAVVFALSRQRDFDTDDAQGMPLATSRSPATLLTAKALDKVRNMQPGAVGRTLDELCDPAGPFAGWQWQQPLRAMRHSRGRLELMCAVLTKEAEAQYKAFKAVADPLLTEMGARLERSGRTIGAFDYNEITAALEEAIEFCRQECRAPYEAMCIDMTGGTAVFSAAATVKTLNSEVRLAYVVTVGAPGEGDVVVYEPSIRA